MIKVIFLFLIGLSALGLKLPEPLPVSKDPNCEPLDPETVVKPADELTKITVDSAPICADRAEWFNGKVKIGRPRSDLIRLTAEKDPRFVILGENHFAFEANSKQVEIVNDLKKSIPKLDCIFMELPEHEEVKAALDELKTKGRTENKLIASVAERVTAFRMAGLEVIPVDSPEYYRRQNFASEAERAKAEEAETFSQYLMRVTSVEAANERDRYMSKKIMTHFAKKGDQCKKGVMIVGKLHQTDETEDRFNLAEHMRKNLGATNISSIALIPSGDRYSALESLVTGRTPVRRDIEWNWSGCGVNPRDVENEVFFQTKDAPKNVTVIPDGGRWEDFDAALVIPN